MFVVCVTVRVVPEYAEAFIVATRTNAGETRRERKNVRFDVLRAIDDPCQFFLYEVYRDEEGFRDHQRADHYVAWKNAVAPWMTVPRQGVKHVAIFPEPWDAPGE